MPRLSKVPERYLATAKKQAIRRVNDGDYYDACYYFQDALSNHPNFKHLVPLTKTIEITCDLIHGDLSDKNILIEHLKNDF